MPPGKPEQKGFDFADVAPNLMYYALNDYYKETIPDGKEIS